MRFWRGSNSRPSACKADVITTTPQNLDAILCYNVLYNVCRLLSEMPMTGGLITSWSFTTVCFFNNILSIYPKSYL